MTPRDKLHLGALRACVTHIELTRCRGKRRNTMAEEFLVAYRLGMLNMTRTIPTIDVDVDFSHEFYLVGVRGYREVLTQLHILEAVEREGVRGRTAEEV